MLAHEPHAPHAQLGIDWISRGKSGSPDTHLARSWGSTFFGMLSILPGPNSSSIKPGPIQTSYPADACVSASLHSEPLFQSGSGLIGPEVIA